MGTSEFNVGGNPAMELHPIKGEYFNNTETGISSGLVGHLARTQTLLFTFF